MDIIGGNCVLAVIPGRAGSQRLPGKNNLQCGGCPILQYTLDAIRDAVRVTAAVVVTNDKEFAHSARQLGVDVVDEPQELAAAAAPVELAVEYAAGRWERRHGRADIVLICEPNVPLRPPRILDRAVCRLLESDAETDGCLTFEPATVHHPHWAAEITAGAVRFNTVAGTNGQTLPPFYHITSAAYVYRRRSLPKVAAGYAGLQLVGVIHEPGACLHIDTINDWRYFEFLRHRESLELVP